MRVTTTTHTVLDLQIRVLECGDGDPVLFLHGWPTHAGLWRNVLPVVGRGHRAIAIDLPGCGFSDKGHPGRYSLGFHDRFFDALLEVLGIESLGLVVHDLGGPLGLHWAVQNASRVTGLGVLNTLVYPELSWVVKAFAAASFTPGVNRWMTSQRGLRWLMRAGVHTQAARSTEVGELYAKPIQDPASRRALLRAMQGVSPSGLGRIARGLAQLDMPVRVIYGTHDRALPDVAQTMRRLASDLPQAQVTALEDCGHFLQEDAPDQVATLLAEFFETLGASRDAGLG